MSGLFFCEISENQICDFSTSKKMILQRSEPTAKMIPIFVWTVVTAMGMPSGGIQPVLTSSEDR